MSRARRADGGPAGRGGASNPPRRAASARAAACSTAAAAAGTQGGVETWGDPAADATFAAVLRVAHGFVGTKWSLLRALEAAFPRLRKKTLERVVRPEHASRVVGQGWQWHVTSAAIARYGIAGLERAGGDAARVAPTAVRGGGGAGGVVALSAPPRASSLDHAGARTRGGDVSQGAFGATGALGRAPGSGAAISGAVPRKRVHAGGGTAGGDSPDEVVPAPEAKRARRVGEARGEDAAPSPAEAAICGRLASRAGVASAICRTDLGDGGGGGGGRASLVREFRRFWFLKAVDGDVGGDLYPPPPALDAMWCALLLRPRVYEAFCHDVCAAAGIAPLLLFNRAGAGDGGMRIPMGAGAGAALAWRYEFVYGSVPPDEWREADTGAPKRVILFLTCCVVSTHTNYEQYQVVWCLTFFTHMKLNK